MPRKGSLKPNRVPPAWDARTGRRRSLVEFLKVESAAPLFPIERDPLERDPIVARVEAALLSSREPITPRRIMKLCDLPDTGEVRRSIERLSQLLDRGGSSFRVAEIAGGYQLLSRPDLRPWLERVCRLQGDVPLSGPMLETLAIVAYRQPICRADVEAIRGVQLGEILRHLLEKGLIRMVGKAETLGRPFLYGTTTRFLQVFGLRNLNELPLAESLGRPIGGAPNPSEPAEEGDGEADEDFDDDDDFEDDEDDESE